MTAHNPYNDNKATSELKLEFSLPSINSLLKTMSWLTLITFYIAEIFKFVLGHKIPNFLTGHRKGPCPFFYPKDFIIPTYF